MPPTPQTPCERLRAATWQRHRRIEKCARLKRMFDADYRLDEYAELLGRFHGFYAAAEPLLAARLGGPEEAPFRRPAKLPLLARDLESLGPQAPPGRPVPPPVHSAVDAIGVSYVLEGSTLGGQLISKRLSGHFGAGAEPALGFFRSYGEEALPRWLAFKEALDLRFAGDGEGVEALVRAADATYLALTDWLERPV